jgi:2-methylcitrate dehydratase PrpD
VNALLEHLFAAGAPPDVRRLARLLLLDTLGCIYAGLAHPKLRALQADPAARLATAACWDEACEGSPRAHGRPGVPVIAACLAFPDGNLGELLDALIVGYEVGGRMGEALRIRPGMHVDASWPSLGAAAAVVRLKRGSARQAAMAIEIAASQLPFSLYLPIEQGADGRNTYLGHAAWLGTFAAQAALAGIDAPSGALERFAELALQRPLPRLTHDGYLIREGYLKRHAAVRHVHYGVEAALRMRTADTREISGIRLSIYREAVTYCGNRAPRTPIQAQFSLSFGIAAALRHGRLDADLYADAFLADPELKRLEALVRLDPVQTERRTATLVLETAQGLREERVTDLPPMSETEVRAKFIANAARGLAADAAGSVADALLAGPESRSLQSILPQFWGRLET